MSASTHLHKSFLGHPRQLFSLFSIEMFERFSFYGMQGILMIYLYYAATEGGLGIDKTVAGGIFPPFSAVGRLTASSARSAPSSIPG